MSSRDDKPSCDDMLSCDDMSSCDDLSSRDGASPAMACHHVMTFHHVMMCRHTTTCQHVMTCHHMMTCHHDITCHHAMTRLHVMIASYEDVPSCDVGRKIARVSESHSGHPGKLAGGSKDRPPRHMTGVVRVRCQLLPLKIPFCAKSNFQNYDFGQPPFSNVAFFAKRAIHNI